MYYVYVLQSLITGEFYKGISNNIDRRLKQHFGGKTVFGKIKSPIKLIHVDIVDNSQNARKLEKYLKSGFGREIIAEVAELADAHDSKSCDPNRS